MATDVCVLLGRRLRAARTAKGWAQTYLSVHAGVGRNYISDVELGRKEIGFRNLCLLAECLDVPLDKLLYGFGRSDTLHTK